MSILQQHTPIPFEVAQDRYAYDLWRDESDGEDPFHQHLLNAFRVAVIEELTEIQRTYIVAYYYDRNTMEEIAEKFAVNKSTVSRTINTAKKRLERVLRYASPILLKQGCYIGTSRSNNKRKRCPA